MSTARLGGPLLDVVLAFAVACGVALGATPLARRLAIVMGFLDEPAERKSHRRAIPYLGGAAIFAGAAAGVLTTTAWDTRFIAMGLGAVLLLAIGLVDDRWTIHPSLRIGLQVGAASLAMVAGVRILLTGNVVVDSALTLLFIVGVTNAVNLMDNMDGLAASTGAVVATGIAVLGLLGGQTLVAVVGGAIGGALLGFLGHNLRPATIFMGDGGSLPLGFALAVLAIEVTPAITPPTSFLVPVLLLGVLIADTATVTLARLRHGRAISQGGRDHLSHRLVASGTSIGGAVTRLAGIQALLAGLAVAVGAPLAVMGAGMALAAGGLAVVAGLGPAWRTAVYEELPRVSVRRLTASFAVAAALTAAVAAGFTEKPMAAEALTLGMHQAAPGASVTVAAAGFAPDSMVEVEIAERSTEQLRADADGTLAAAVELPNVPAGPATIEATGTTAGGTVRTITGIVEIVHLRQAPAPASMPSMPLVLAGLAGTSAVAVSVRRAHASRRTLTQAG